ncbi:pyridine nucleotide-disulfide oxidoreductase, partial [Acidithiobacillus sp. GGI-221]
MTERVLILGGGFAGTAAARALRGQGLEVTLIDQRNYHLFQPLLYQVAAGDLQAEAIATPQRRLLRGGLHFRLGRVARLRLPQRSILLDDGDILSYDYLFIALGTVTNFFGQCRHRQPCPADQRHGSGGSGSFAHLQCSGGSQPLHRPRQQQR